MATGFFGNIEKIKYDPNSTSPLAFRHYNPDEVVMGKQGDLACVEKVLQKKTGKV